MSTDDNFHRLEEEINKLKKRIHGDFERHNLIEELRIVQDILLKQEAYSLGAFRFSFVIIVGLMVAYLSEKINLDKNWFVGFITASCFGFAYVQSTYRKTFHKGLE